MQHLAYPLVRLAQDRRVPWVARIAAVIGVAYFACPFDLIPDSVPVIGYFDDAAILGHGVLVAKLTAPPEIIAEHLAWVAARSDGGTRFIPLHAGISIARRNKRAEATVPGSNRFYRLTFMIVVLLAGLLGVELALRGIFQVSIGSEYGKRVALWLLTIFGGATLSLAFLYARSTRRNIARLSNVKALAERGGFVGSDVIASKPFSGLHDYVGYRRRWQILSIADDSCISDTSPILIGGCGRSGTTLLPAILANHPDISAGPESTVFLKRVTAPAEIDYRFGWPLGRTEELERISRSQAEFIDLFQHECLRFEGKSVWADKTPRNVERLKFIWHHFPNARFVHVIRDGRDVVCSLRRQPWMKLKGLDSNSTEALIRCIDYWVSDVQAGRRYKVDPRYFEVEYTDLILDTERTLRRLLASLQIDWSGKILEPELLARSLEKFHRLPSNRNHGLLDKSNGSLWRRELSKREVEIFKARAGHLLIELGCERDLEWSV